MSKVKHILYADDDEDDHIFFKEAFKELKIKDCVISSVYDGEQVLDFLQKRGIFSSVTAPDLLILDLNMPVIDGIGILKIIRNHERLKDLPVYILSVSDKDYDIKACEEIGISQFYTKPTNFSRLKKTIESIIDHYSKSKISSK